MKVELWPIDRLIPYARNPRKNDASVDAVAASIKEYGFRQPIVVDEQRVIIVGHTRYKAAQKLGLTEVPVHVATGLTPAQIKAYRIADNSAGSKSEWDAELLKIELDDLPDFDPAAFNLDMENLGLDGLATEQDAEPQVDRAAELNEKWKVKTGDLWLIGDHRLLCGDSTKSEDVARCLVDAKPMLMVTDPPYGVEYDAGWRDEAAKKCPAMGNRKDTAKGAVTNDDRADWREAWALFPGDVAYVWHAGLQSWKVAESLIELDFQIRAQIVWGKDRFAVSQGAYHFQHEPCWYAVRKGATAHWCGDRKQATLWTIAIPWDNYGNRKPEAGDEKNSHSTQKPMECMARPMRNHHAPEVYDPFLGSGTTMVAAQNLGRKCFGLEISPAYCAVILERMITAFPDIDIRRGE